MFTAASHGYTLLREHRRWFAVQAVEQIKSARVCCGAKNQKAN
jgi:hypothetical protein